MFRTQDGNVMHALAGQITVADAQHATYAYPCAAGTFERVRFSYSVDDHSRLAIRAADERPALKEGLILENIAHNVLAIGLRIKRRTEPLPASCRVRPPPRCTAPGSWCECTRSCLRQQLCRKREHEGTCE